jgi:uncharacterized protein (TIGR00369 family)
MKDDDRGPSQISQDQVADLTQRELPWAADLGLATEALAYGYARVRLPYTDRNLRPGGTMSGPSMISLADYALYIGALAAIGPEALAVTSQLSMNFLRKPRPGDLIADATMLRIGRRVVFGEVAVITADAPASGAVAHLTGSLIRPDAPE